MIQLYVKQHSKTGLKYFGKTNGNDPHYKGSGKYWKDHIRQHGRQFVENIETYEFDNIDEASEFAIAYSYAWNIVESKEWANLKIEDALNGGCPKGVKHNDEANKRKSIMLLGNKRGLNNKNNLGKTWSEESRLKMLGNTNSLGTQFSETTKQRMSEISKSRPVVACTVCNKEGQYNLIKRWHFDNCKQRVQ